MGAATGAIVRAAVGSPGATCPAIGGGLGAVTGALVGNELQNHEDREKQIEARLREGNSSARSSSSYTVRSKKARAGSNALLDSQPNG